MKAHEDRLWVEPLRLRHESRGRAIAAPSPLMRRGDHSRSHGIEHDVPGDLQKIRLAIDEMRLEPPLEKMSDTLVSAVEPGGVVAVEILHPQREVRLRR